MTLALLGVFIMQLYYIKESYKLQSQLFEQDINQVLGAVVSKVQKRNVAVHINRKDFQIKTEREQGIKAQTDTIVAFRVKFKENENIRKLKQQQEIIDYLNLQDSVIRELYVNPQIISEETYKVISSPNLGADSAKNLNLIVEDIKDFRTGKIVSRRLRSNLPKGQILQNGKLPDNIRYVAFDPVTMLPKSITFPSIDPDLALKFKVENAKAEKKYHLELNRLYSDTLVVANLGNLNLIQDVAKELENQDVPLAKRIPSMESLDTLIKSELLSKKITLNYDFWITPANNKHQVVYKKKVIPDEDTVTENESTFSRVLFGNDVATKDPGIIYLRFSGKSSLIFSNMAVTMASSAALLFVLIFIFAYTIFAIIRQKKLSEMKTDFINNMTHEFKTPVATIMIASEALKDPEIVEDKNRIGRLAGIIYDENVRLGNHIERVLSVARLEKKEIKLEYNPVKINELIAAVLDSMNLQLQKRDAVVTMDLSAVNDTVMGDELHLSNVIYNLIDNANKYSASEPKIHLATRSNGKKLYIEVSDEGIGMTKDQAKRIFDQFYRVPTGNLHNVKGFGLGLNYVQDIVTQLGGTIKVQSEKDKGSTFEVTLPVKQSN